jgi:histidyl-tRNA synthetase
MQGLPPRGMRDFYPDQMRTRNWLFSRWRESAIRYGFEEYSSSVVEQEELFILKSGEEIVSQLFNFTDKGGRRVALRPEMTPTFARMIAAKGGALAKPLKWFSIAQCFRYERMSKGRKREHYQWNLDLVGVPEVTAEAELLAVALDALEGLGLSGKDVVVRISHRGLLGAVLEALDIPQESWTGVFGIIDKRGKESDETLWKLMEAQGVPEASIRALFCLLEEKGFDPFYELLLQKGLPTASVEDLRALFDYLGAYGVGDYCEFSPSIVRGLPYYTGIVFECFDREGKYRAIFGGGRYDNLLELFGAGPLPSAGLGFGDVVIQEILQEKGLLPGLSRRIDFFLVPFSQEERAQAICTVQQLRKQGFCSDLVLNAKKLKGALREGARLRANRVVLLLPEELKQGLLVLRDLESGQEERIPEEKFLEDPGRFLQDDSNRPSRRT